ncbi:MAG: hypothetical protein U9N62_06280 [Thermotogota bacterium]|nr:hypothetical protein [Thermotogota bacterium]
MEVLIPLQPPKLLREHLEAQTRQMLIRIGKHQDLASPKRLKKVHLVKHLEALILTTFNKEFNNFTEMEVKFFSPGYFVRDEYKTDLKPGDFNKGAQEQEEDLQDNYFQAIGDFAIKGYLYYYLKENPVIQVPSELRDIYLQKTKSKNAGPGVTVKNS